MNKVRFRRLHKNKKWRKMFVNVEQELVNRSDWPVITCDADVGSLDLSQKRADVACKYSAAAAGKEIITDTN